MADSGPNARSKNSTDFLSISANVVLSSIRPDSTRKGKEFFFFFTLDFFSGSSNLNLAKTEAEPSVEFARGEVPAYPVTFRFLAFLSLLHENRSKRLVLSLGTELTAANGRLPGGIALAA